MLNEKIQEKNRLCTFLFAALLEVKFFYGLVVSATGVGLLGRGAISRASLLVMFPQLSRLGFMLNTLCRSDPFFRQH